MILTRGKLNSWRSSLRICSLRTALRRKICRRSIGLYRTVTRSGLNSKVHPISYRKWDGTICWRWMRKGKSIRGYFTIMGLWRGSWLPCSWLLRPKSRNAWLCRVIIRFKLRKLKLFRTKYPRWLISSRPLKTHTKRNSTKEKNNSKTTGTWPSSNWKTCNKQCDRIR